MIFVTSNARFETLLETTTSVNIKAFLISFGSIELPEELFEESLEDSLETLLDSTLEDDDSSAEEDSLVEIADDSLDEEELEESSFKKEFTKEEQEVNVNANNDNKNKRFILPHDYIIIL